MRCVLGAFVAVAAMLATAGQGNAVQQEKLAPSTVAKEFGRSLPPIGFVKFCASNPKECRNVGRRAQRVALTPDLWSELYQVNTKVNTTIAPMTDQELYGQAEYWTYPTDAGDCEDYLLLKKRELEAMGFDSGALLITVVLDEKKEGHAVLTVASTDGDYVLDNRRNDILTWNSTGYTFLKRQSQQDPRAWVSLTETQDATVKTVAGN